MRKLSHREMQTLVTELIHQLEAVCYRAQTQPGSEPTLPQTGRQLRDLEKS